MSGNGGALVGENEEATRWRGFEVMDRGRNSRRVVRRPIRQLDALFDFSSFVTVFLGFLRAVDDLPEGVLGANDFGDYIQ
jgi:hypothetical protein